MLANPGSVSSCLSLWSQDSKGQSSSVTGNIDDATQVPEVNSATCKSTITTS